MFQCHERMISLAQKELNISINSEISFFNFIEKAIIDYKIT